MLDPSLHPVTPVAAEAVPSLERPQMLFRNDYLQQPDTPNLCPFLGVRLRRL